MGPPASLQHLVEPPPCLPCPRAAWPVPTAPSSTRLHGAFAHGHWSLIQGDLILPNDTCEDPVPKRGREMRTTRVHDEVTELGN